MRDTLRISNVRFVPAPLALRSTGLLGWATVTLNDGVFLGYIAVRRTLDGRTVLAFPEHTDRGGRTYPIVRPLDQGARDAITEQVLNSLIGLRVLP